MDMVEGLTKEIHIHIYEKATKVLVEVFSLTIDLFPQPDKPSPLELLSSAKFLQDL